MAPAPDAVHAWVAVLVLGLASIVTVALRLLARRVSRAPFQLADQLILAALLVLFGFIACCGILVYDGGIGTSIETLSSQQRAIYFKVEFATQLIYILTITLVKLSILLFYSNLFPIQPFYNIARIAGIVCISWFMTSTFLTFFQCSPTSAAWNWLRYQGARCIDISTLSTGIAISNMVTDVITLCLPLPVVWGLMLPARQKIVLSLIFCMGSLVCVASVLRIVSFHSIDESNFPLTALSGGTWSIIEAELAIICACLPTLRPIFSKNEWIRRCRARGAGGQTLPRSRPSFIAVMTPNMRSISDGASSYATRGGSSSSSLPSPGSSRKGLKPSSLIEMQIDMDMAYSEADSNDSRESGTWEEDLNPEARDFAEQPLESPGSQCEFDSKGIDLDAPFERALISPKKFQRGISRTADELGFLRWSQISNE